MTKILACDLEKFNREVRVFNTSAREVRFQRIGSNTAKFANMWGEA